VRRWAARRGIEEATVLEVARRPEQRIEVSPRRELRQSRVLDRVSGKLRLVSKLRKYWREQ
jgi:hypothetical protein